MKKIINVIGVFGIVMAMFFNTNISNGASSDDIDLTSLTSLSTAEAEAECRGGAFLDGRCNTFSQHCFANPFPEDQDCNTYNSTW